MGDLCSSAAKTFLWDVVSVKLLFVSFIIQTVENWINDWGGVTSFCSFEWLIDPAPPDISRSSPRITGSMLANKAEPRSSFGFPGWFKCDRHRRQTADRGRVTPRVQTHEFLKTPNPNADPPQGRGDAGRFRPSCPGRTYSYTHISKYKL